MLSQNAAENVDDAEVQIEVESTPEVEVLIDDEVGSSSMDDRDMETLPPQRKQGKMFDVDLTNQCPLCDFLGQDVADIVNHTKIQHQVTQTFLLKCKECGAIFFNNKKLDDHVSSIHGVARKRVPIQLVLVKKKKLSWPAVVKEMIGDSLKVQMVADDAVITVSKDDTEAFSMDKIKNSKNLSCKQFS